VDPGIQKLAGFPCHMTHATKGDCLQEVRQAQVKAGAVQPGRVARAPVLAYMAQASSNPVANNSSFFDTLPELTIVSILFICFSLFVIRMNLELWERKDVFTEFKIGGSAVAVWIMFHLGGYLWRMFV
jgi:hypothetical protein